MYRITLKVALAGHGQRGQKSHRDCETRKSTRRLSQETDLSSSVMCIMHEDLHLFPYKIQILQLQVDAKRLRDVSLGKPSVRESHTILISWTYIFFSDEANFHLSDHVKKQNMHFGAQAHEQQYRSLSVEKVTVSCVLGPNSNIESYWL